MAIFEILATRKSLSYIETFFAQANGFLHRYSIEKHEDVVYQPIKTIDFLLIGYVISILTELLGDQQISKLSSVVYYFK